MEQSLLLSTRRVPGGYWSSLWRRANSYSAVIPDLIRNLCFKIFVTTQVAGQLCGEVSLAVGWWREGLAGEEGADGFNGVDRAFSGGRDVAPDAAEGGRPGLTAERPGDLLLHFGHPNVPFGLVVVERHAEVVHERQRFFPVVVETFQ